MEREQAYENSLLERELKMCAYVALYAYAHVWWFYWNRSQSHPRVLVVLMWVFKVSSFCESWWPDGASPCLKPLAPTCLPQTFDTASFHSGDPGVHHISNFSLCFTCLKPRISWVLAVNLFCICGLIGLCYYTVFSVLP